MMKATLDQGGRVELPAVVQVELGVKPGDELSFEQLGGAWVIRPVVPKATGTNVLQAADDDLNWPELEYDSLSPRRVGEALVNFEHRGRLKPMPIELEES